MTRRISSVPLLWCNRLLVLQSLVVACLFVHDSVYAGFVNLPVAEIGAGESSSPIVTCYDSDQPSHRLTAESTTDACSLTLERPLSPPLPGFRMVATAVRHAEATTDPSLQTIKIGTVRELVWRNDNSSECIYAAHLILHAGAALESVHGQPPVRITEFSRNGFGRDPIAAAYVRSAQTMAPVYRIARLASLAENPAVAQPGVDPDWVTFETLVTTFEKKKVRAASSTFLVKSACSAEPPQAREEAIHLRQLEGRPMTIRLPGFVPSTQKSIDHR